MKKEKKYELKYNTFPIAKLFKKEDQYYLYDTNLNNIYVIKNELYVELAIIMNIGLKEYLTNYENSKLYNDVLSLLEKGFLKSNIIVEIEHPETYYIDSLIERGISDITLQVTKNCNFSCRYCAFANDNNIGRVHQNTKMSVKVAKDAIDFLFKHSQDVHELTIAFYGGEPMLNFELIKEVVEYANSKFFTKKIKYLMTTNASILNDEMLALLVKNNFEISISLDGPKNIQNRHRKFFQTGKGTFDIVYNNLMKIKNKNSDFFYNNLFFLPVAFQDEDENQILDFFDLLGIDRNRVKRVIADLKGVDYLHNYQIDNIEKVVEKNSINVELDERYLNVYNDKSQLPEKWHHNGPCVPGMQRLFVNVDGVLHLCEKSMEDDYLSIGDIYDGFNINKIKKFMNIGKITENECKRCWAMRFCNICLMFCNDVEQKAITYEKKILACEQIKKDTLSFFKRKIVN